VTTAYLILGIDTRIALVPETLAGEWGFLPDGNLISRSLGLEGVDSRLKLPSTISLRGAANENYSLNPVGDAYLNHYADHPVPQNQPPAGWVNIPAKVDVPFFEDIKAHVHTAAHTNVATAFVYLMGGWPRADGGDNHGWQINGLNFFTADYFDEGNRGFASAPANLTPEQYRNYDSEEYHVRAQRTWLGVINFDYPLNWSPITRSFRSIEPKEDNFLVLRTENEAKFLSAEHAELTFGAQFDVLPTANLVSMAFNAVDEATGVSTAVANALGAPAQQAISDGLGRLDQLLATDQHELYEQVFDTVIQPRIDTLYDDLQSAYANEPTLDDFLDEAGVLAQAAIEGAQPDSLRSRLINLAGNGPGDPGLMQQVTNHLGHVETAVDLLRQIVEPDGGGNFNLAANLAHELVAQIAPDFLAGFASELVLALLGENEIAMEKIVIVHEGMSRFFEDTRLDIATPNGLGSELQDKLGSAAGSAEINAFAPAITSAFGDFVLGIDYTVDLPFDDFTEAEFKARIRQELEDQFHGAQVASDLQSILKQRLYDENALLREASDSLFRTVNDVIRDVITQTAANIGSEFTEFLGGFGGSPLAAEINGYAHINGDSLNELRIDVHARLSVPDDMEFAAWLRIKELDSEGNNGCDYGAGTATEVTLGASAALDWFGPGLNVNAETKFTFGDGPGVPVLGVAGSFELAGSLNFQAFEITYLGAALGFGVNEAYISGGGGFRLNKYEIFGGAFFGRACSIDPIKLWDPHVASVLGPPPFTGAYTYGEIWFPINELIGVPSSCFFNLAGGFGMGAGFFVEGPTAIGKIKYGVSGDLLCILSFKGELTGIAKVEIPDLTDGGAASLADQFVDGLTIKAVGKLTGSIGPCPICLKGSKSAALLYKNRKWKFEH
jgi:hypothetical protein